MIYKRLKKEFDYMMSKINTHHRSKRFISQLTTMIRALQLSMNLGNQTTSGTTLKQKNIDPKLASQLEMKIPDNEVIALFVNFYKLLFLGTPFSRKVLKIKLQGNDK